MRLLKVPADAGDFFPELVDFAPDRIPRYAILSHRWGDPADEIVFSDLSSQDEIKKDVVRAKPGFLKFRHCCMQALADGLEYARIDTCCIDKSSSADLSEAINSMFTWYGKAAICYVYLDDIPEAVEGTSAHLTKTLWVTRVWTLQELLAPRHIKFYSPNWIEIGTKKSLSRTLSRLTGIDEDILTGKKSIESEDVGRRMSWASRRQTTRPEDIAYCLMGIFSVNMPMLYGEGDRAFIRLQEEIIKTTEDHSIFAWTDPDASEESHQGLLARHPSCFQRYLNTFYYRRHYVGEPIAMTSRGLRIPLSIKQLSPNLFLATIDCQVLSSSGGPKRMNWLAVYLEPLSSDSNSQFARVKCGTLGISGNTRELQTVYVRQMLNGLKPGVDYPLDS